MDADLARPPAPPPPPPPGPSAQDRAPHLSRMSSRRPRTADLADKQRQQWDTHAVDLAWDWVNEEDMLAFQQRPDFLLSSTLRAQALSDEPSALGADVDQPERIVAASDWAPVKERKRSRGPRKRKDVVREGWAYHVSRWPLLLLIFFIIFLEFVAYLVVRQLVNVIEFFAGWRGERGRLRLALRHAETYDEWKTRALALDALLGLNHWKASPSNAYYDAPLVRRVLRALRALREQGDAEGVCAVLHACVRNNFAGVESFHLYSESYYGTKALVQEYLDEVTRSLEFIRTTTDEQLPADEKADFFRSVAKNLGASALCLSGGASMGYYHFGVVKALLDEDLLPRVVTGTSAGAIVAALCCTRTDAELRALLHPSLADRITACSEPFSVWAARAWRTGARFDTVEWARKASFFTLGSMTFREAFERTGRILNVSVIPSDTHSPTKLLNYLSAPDCVIYTAVIASAAVPGIINPVVLLTKDKEGKLHPWEFQGKHKDGSLRVDIPLQALHLLYNVNFSIVSQVNPHIHLFHFAPRGSPGRPVSHRQGRGWRGGFLLAAAEGYCKIELVKWFRVIRDLELMPELGGQNWSGVFLQKFEGSVTIWPKSRFKDWFRLLTDPDRDELARMIRVGQRVTWPKIKMIENRLKIERQVDLGRQEARARLTSSSSTNGAVNSNGNGHGAALAPPPLTRHNSSGDHLLVPRGPSTSSSSSSSAGPARARTASPPARGEARPDLSSGSGGEGDDPHDDDDGEGEGEYGGIEGLDAVRVDDNSAAAKKRRRAILERLGLRGAAGRGSSAPPASGGGGGGSASGSDGGVGTGGRYREEEGEGADSDWTSGGEGASPSLGPLGGAGVRRRLRSSSLGQVVGFSSDEEGPAAGTAGRW
ncbi:acyl transferase/acyl hydrolase/lysophospholipase [Rhodotorula diobovata]|uniref:Acyl transferase/acyl hydrolase/lysophospholipase n=1 Tax=Rhodotorula diobovata TaxID=5288 RepID=A0A5C5FNU1_9BASI|nr:acyl transferase/acyl hydrolase/lysophospholipase [Rhodotorula diobovata]